MANLESAGERAQVLLVTALILGVTFVVLALLLNSAIFTENLASRGETSGADGVVSYQGDLTRSAGTLLAYENRNASDADTHTVVRDRVDRGVAQIDRILVHRQAKRGSLANASVVGLEDGSRIFQTDHMRNFTDGNAQADWTVATGVTQTRAFRLNVTRSTLPTCGLFTDCYVLTVTDGSAEWNVSISDDVGGVEVRVDNETGTSQSCDLVNEPDVTVDLTAGTVGGEPCPALSFADAPGGPYAIEFTNADRIDGTYTMVVDNEAIAATPPARFDPAGADPAVTPAIYDLTLGYEYRTPDLTVANEIRVAPGEFDG